MGLRSGGGEVAAMGSCSSGGGGVAMLKASLDSGGGDGHTSDMVTIDPPPLGSLASDLGARVLVGLLCTLPWILAICLGAGLGGESSTGMTSTGSSSSSSSATVTPSPPSLGLGDESTILLGATG
jgi:hypothetical protein